LEEDNDGKFGLEKDLRATPEPPFQYKSLLDRLFGFGSSLERHDERRMEDKVWEKKTHSTPKSREIVVRFQIPLFPRDTTK
jgi:hypothetical protein